MSELQKKYPIIKYILIVVSSIIFIGTLVVTFLMLTRGDYMSHLEPYSFLGLFIIALITGSPLPIPTFCVLLVFTLGSVENPFMIGLITGLGVALGHMVVYLSGFGGYKLFAVFNIPDLVSRANLKMKERILKSPKLGKALDYLSRHAIFSMFLMSAIPNPFQMPALFTLGAKRVSFWKVFGVCLAGRTIFYVFLACLGNLGLQLFGLHYRI